MKNKNETPDNRFYIGDCLPVLAELVADHGQFVDLVYLDPPFNSDRLYNHTFRGFGATTSQKVAFRDTWKWSPLAQNDFREFVEEESPSSRAARFLSAMRSHLEEGDADDKSTLAYLTYMTRRLARIHSVMKPTASVYLHCDQSAAHYLKMMMDAVFGRKNFRNDIIWKRTSGKSNTTKIFPRIHDNLLFYAKSSDAPFFPPVTPYDESFIKEQYNLRDEKGRRFASGDLISPGGVGDTVNRFEFMGVTRSWRYNKEKNEEIIGGRANFQTFSDRRPAKKTISG